MIDDYAETQRNRFRVLESKLYDEIGKLKTELKKLKKDVKDFLNYKREIESEIFCVTEKNKKCKSLS